MPLTLVDDLVRRDGLADCVKLSSRMIQKEVVFLRWEYLFMWVRVG
jgi:hypothetical protein